MDLERRFVQDINRLQTSEFTRELLSALDRFWKLRDLKWSIWRKSGTAEAVKERRELKILLFQCKMD